MNDFRQTIISNIKNGLQRKGESADVNGMFATLTAQKEVPVQPELAAESGLTDKLVETFSQAAIDVATEVHSLGSLDLLPQWVKDRAEGLKEQPSLAISPQFDNSPSIWAPLNLVENSADDPKCWGLAKGFSGVAETGTVVSLSSDCPSGLLFLVERLIVVLERADILAYQEDVWTRLRSQHNGRVPRTVNLITGPSRTADVAQQIQIGAHGPKWADYLIVG